MKRVCHLSSAHSGLDTRIFHKQCVSLASAGFETHLVIEATAEEVRRAEQRGVILHSLPTPAGRLSRMALQPLRCLFTALRIKADVYHFHDPELIPCGVLLAIFGKIVVYDVHEDAPRDVLVKDWIPLWLRKLASAALEAIEHGAARHFLFIVSATPFIAKRFTKVTSDTVVVNNFPLLKDLEQPAEWAAKRREICYVGGIAEVRGIREICAAMEQVDSDVRINLAGKFSGPVFEQAVRAMPGWHRVSALGFLDRGAVREVLGRSMAGLVTLHPITTYIDSLPVKMFEYMGAGIPVIASDFPLWRKIIEGESCGLLVDPLDPAAIARAINYLVRNPDIAQRMGCNGRRAAFERYNWALEERKLLNFYSQRLNL